MPHAKFTTRWVKTVKPPQSGQVDYIDQKNARFTLRVTANGIKTWTTLYRFHGRRRRFVLGRFPSVSLSEAKKRAFAVFAQVSADVDPAAIREQHARDGTFHELQKQFVLHAQTKKNWKQDVWVINRHLLPRWKHIKARDIAAADVLAVFDSLRERPVLANRVLALVSRIFTFAIGRQWRPDNPAGRIKKHPEPGRDRVLSEDEIRAIWNALNTEDPLHEAIFKLRFLTAARGCEIRTMRWEDVSFQSGWWTIPRERAKNGVAHRVPLLPDTVAILEKLRTWQESRRHEINAGRRLKRLPPRRASEWVFPSTRGDSDCFRWEQRAALRIRDRSGIDFRFHDVRRTVATSMTEHCGVDRFILKKVLNHSEKRDVTAVYDRATYDLPKRRAFEAWARYLRTVIEGQSADSNVVVMQRVSR